MLYLVIGELGIPSDEKCKTAYYNLKKQVPHTAVNNPMEKNLPKRGGFVEENLNAR